MNRQGDAALHGSGSDLLRLQSMILAFAAEREWQQFHDPKNLAMAIAVEAGELIRMPNYASEWLCEAVDNPGFSPTQVSHRQRRQHLA